MDTDKIMKSQLPGTLPPNNSSALSDSRSNLKNMKLKKACADFEGILLNYMFEAMRKTVGEGGVFGKSHQKDMYESMFAQEVSATLARGKGVGLGEALYRQVAGRNDDPCPTDPLKEKRL